MKLAILIGLSADKREAWPLSDRLVPFDEALKTFKAMNETRQGPAPYVELWCGGTVVKRARLTVVDAAAAETETEVEAVGETPAETEAVAEAAAEVEAVGEIPASEAAAPERKKK